MLHDPTTLGEAFAWLAIALGVVLLWGALFAFGMLLAHHTSVDE